MIKMRVNEAPDDPRIQRNRKHEINLLAPWRCGSNFNSSPPGQHGHHFADGIFRCIFMKEKFYILIKTSLRFVPKGPIDNNPALI